MRQESSSPLTVILIYISFESFKICLFLLYRLFISAFFCWGEVLPFVLDQFIYFCVGNGNFVLRTGSVMVRGCVQVGEHRWMEIEPCEMWWGVGGAAGVS